MTPLSAHLAIDFFVKGGFLMWPILALLLTALFVLVDRSLWWIHHHHRSRPEIVTAILDAIGTGDYARALRLAEGCDDPAAHALRDGIAHAHTSLPGAMQLRATAELDEAERRLWILSTLITLAPLIGLLGTVTGIMDSFHFVGHEQLAASKVSGGIAQALIATAAGLGIAILCLIPFNFFHRKVALLRSSLERTINHAELLAESARNQGHDPAAFARSHARAVSPCTAAAA